VWRNGHFVVAPAIDGVHADRNRRVRGGKGGVALAIGPRIKPFLQRAGILASYRGVWAIIDHPRLGKLGFLSVYAPNTPSKRTLLWRELYRELDSTCKWIIFGDLNMIENPTDRKGGRVKLITGAEKGAWCHLKRRLKLVDTFQPRPAHLLFSWDSLFKGRHIRTVQDGEIGNRRLRRLD
jgi:hypothetical protein